MADGTGPATLERPSETLGALGHRATDRSVDIVSIGRHVPCSRSTSEAAGIRTEAPNDIVRHCPEARAPVPGDPAASMTPCRCRLSE